MLLAAPSEGFSWKRWPYGKECSACGKTLRVEDVGETREVYSYANGRGEVVARYLWCKEHRGHAS